MVVAAIGMVLGLWSAGKFGFNLPTKWLTWRANRDRYAQPPETIEEADRRIKDDPKNPRHHLSRSELLSDQGLHLEALGAVDKALAMRETPEAVETRSRINLEAGNFADAIEDAEHAVRLGASKINTALTIGHALRSKGDFAAAEKQADMMLELGDTTARPFWLRALALIQQNKLQEALPDVLKVIRADDSNLGSRLVAASVYLDLGDAHNAISQYKKVLELGDVDPNVFRDLGDAYMMAGDRVQAKATYHQALAIDPDHAGANEALQSMDRSRVVAISHAVLDNIMRKVSWSG